MAASSRVEKSSSIATAGLSPASARIVKPISAYLNKMAKFSRQKIYTHPTLGHADGLQLFTPPGGFIKHFLRI